MSPSEALVPHEPLMLDMVDQTLAHCATKGFPPKVNTSSFPEVLVQAGATFVTLEKKGRLRGCIGTLQAHQPLILDLISNAYRAGFMDPRFPALTAEELPSVASSISILNKPEPLKFDDEEDLMSQLRPGSDGLILEDRGRRGTFLPQVWDQLPLANDFFTHLKTKAGLPRNHWSDSLQVYRYTVHKFGPRQSILEQDAER